MEVQVQAHAGRPELLFKPLPSLPPSLPLSPAFPHTVVGSSTNAVITFHLFWSLLHFPQFHIFSSPPPPLFSALQQRNSGWGGPSQSS